MLAATRRGLARFGGRLANVFKGFTGLLARAFKGLVANVRALPRHLKRGARAVLRVRPSERAWTLFLALGAVALGTLLVIAPAKDLATGKRIGLQTLVSFCWLVAGLATSAGGMGVFLRWPSFRWLFKLAFTCSLPVAGAFTYRTATLAVKMRTAPESEREVLEAWVSGGVQLSAFFIGTSIFLFALLRSQGLKRLHSSGAVLARRAGWLIRGVAGAALGSGVGYLIWVLLRWLSDPMNGILEDTEWFNEVIRWINEAIRLVPVNFFIAAGALLGAIVAIAFFRSARKPGPMARSAQPPVQPDPAATTSQQKPYES